MIKASRKRIIQTRKDPYKIVDSFPLTVNKFGKAYFGKRLKWYSSYGYRASKKEHYYGMKVHVITDSNGEPLDYLLTKVSVEDKEALFDLATQSKIDNLLADKGYVEPIDKELRKEFGIKLYALKRSNCKIPLSKPFCNRISKLRRRIETTFGLSTMLEIKFLCFNLLTFIGGSTQISHVINFY